MPDAKNCLRCGQQFIPNRHWQVYCSRQCNRLAYFARALTGDPPPTKLDSPPLEAWKSELPETVLEQQQLETTDERTERIVRLAQEQLDQKEAAPSWHDKYGDKK